MDEFVEPIDVSSNENPPSIGFGRIENNCHALCRGA